MSITWLSAISEADLPLLVEDPEEFEKIRRLLDDGLILGADGAVKRLPDGQVVVTQPALIRDVTRAGRPFLRSPDPCVDALAELL